MKLDQPNGATPTMEYVVLMILWSMILLVINDEENNKCYVN